MANSSEFDLIGDPDARDPLVDWADMVRLAAIVSVFAAAAAMALAGHVSETTIVLSVIVVATMASWFHIEHASRPPRPPMFARTIAARATAEERRSSV